ncbi:MAG: winged helix-turn-helix transcriptional regulator [Candidatus Krumholzibacteria bacterium]|nr:winged helix-turn-helix transcriptional regulator [Candidatus Krumholzibacteria bacterium]
MDYRKSSDILKAVAHPARMEIIDRLQRNGCNVSLIQKKLELPQSTISQHLKILKNAGIISSRRDGTRVCYKIEIPEIRRIIRMLKKV